MYESAPLAYRVVSYTPQKAVISGWGVALSGNTVGLAPHADFQTATSTLVWSDGDWKLAGGQAVEGPTPSLIRGATPTPAGRLVPRIAGLRGVRYVP